MQGDAPEFLNWGSKASDYLVGGAPRVRINGSPLVRSFPLDPERAHARGERIWIQAQNFCGTARTRYSPMRSFQSCDDAVAFEMFQILATQDLVA